MLPVIQIGPFVLQTSLLALLLAAWAGLAVSARLAPRLGLDGDHLYNAAFGALIAGVLVGRLAHVVTFWSAYRSQPWDIIGLNPRAFVLWPAFAAALVALVWYALSHHLPRARFLDAAAPGLLFGLAVVDLGNWLAGQALGRPAGVPWAITYYGAARHPSGLYELLATLVVLAAVLYVLRRHYLPGRVAWAALLGWGLERWLLEPFRAQSATIAGGLREAQVLGLAAALVALWALGRSLTTRAPAAAGDLSDSPGSTPSAPPG